MSTRGSFWLYLKNHFKWYSPKLLTRTLDTLCNLVLGCITQDWMTRIDLWLRNFLPTTKFRQVFFNCGCMIGELTLIILICMSLFCPDIIFFMLSGFGLHQYISLGCEPSSPFSYHKGKLVLSYNKMQFISIVYCLPSSLDPRSYYLLLVKIK